MTDTNCAPAAGILKREFNPWKENPISATQEWVAALPVDQDTINSLGEENPISLGNESVSDSPTHVVVRKKGFPGYHSVGRQNASDIYQLAQATRKARERGSLSGDCAGNSRANDILHGNLRTQDNRALMLRSAYAAQRLDQANVSFQSETTFSYESSPDFLSGCPEPDAETLLYQLGFGGPSQGLDRVPERFLQPSQVNQLRGVNIEQFFSLQQELDETLETGSLGYRGLTGPSTRRPSTIVARLIERMRDNTKEEYKRKNSAPPPDPSPPPPPPLSAPSAPSYDNKKILNYDDHVVAVVVVEEPLSTPPVEEEEEEEEDKLSLPQPPPPPASSSTTSRRSSLSSRRSSLRRQNCVDSYDEILQPPVVSRPPVEDRSDSAATRLMASLSVSQSESSGFYDLVLHNGTSQTINWEEAGAAAPLPASEEAILPCSATVYVTPPPSIVFSSHAASIDSCPSESSFATSEVDPIISVLQLAAEAYRVRLECPTPAAGGSRRDWNHNRLKEDRHPPDREVASIKEEIRQELARTDHLLQCLHQRLAYARSAKQTYDSTSIRVVLSDMLTLLQQQQRLHQLVTESGSQPSDCLPSHQDLPGGLSSDVVVSSSPSDATCTWDSSGGPLRPGSTNVSYPDHSNSSSLDSKVLSGSWLQSFERRLTSQIRRTVRLEIRRALSATLRAKCKKIRRNVNSNEF